MPKTVRRRPTNCGLTDKQLHFCKYYLINGFNATRAATQAGYKGSHRNRVGVGLMMKPHIKAYIKKSMDRVEKKLDITFDKKADLLWRAAMRCYGLSDDDVERIKAGEHVKPLFEFNATALTSAIAELNKMQGHHAPTKTANVNTETGLDKVDDYLKQYEKEA